LSKVSVLALTGPSNPSIRRIVPRATRERLDSSLCAQPSKARAARICLPVILIKARRYHDETHNPKYMSNMDKLLTFWVNL
jgi:hypothetical protein